MYDKSLKGPIIFIRHGETNFNKNFYKKEDNVGSNEDYLDCSLSKAGRAQSRSLSLKLAEIKIKYVFCSPLNRCLETAYNSLINHPDKENIEIFVNPLITEVISVTQDIPCEIEFKKKVYNEDSEIKYNWDLFDSITNGLENPSNFYLRMIDNFISAEVVEMIKKLITPKEGDFYQFFKYYHTYHERPETLKNLHKRNLLFKEQLREFLLLNNYKESEGCVLVYTHSSFAKMASSRDVETSTISKCYPNDCYSLKNCEAITIDFNSY